MLKAGFCGVLLAALCPTGAVLLCPTGASVGFRAEDGLVSSRFCSQCGWMTWAVLATGFAARGLRLAIKGLGLRLPCRHSCTAEKMGDRRSAPDGAATKANTRSESLEPQSSRQRSISLLQKTGSSVSTTHAPSHHLSGGHLNIWKQGDWLWDIDIPTSLCCILTMDDTVKQSDVAMSCIQYCLTSCFFLYQTTFCCANL